MYRQLLAIGIFTASALLCAAPRNAATSEQTLSAAEIVDKNVAARGGLQAWRAVQTMSLTGKMGAGGNQRATIQTPAPNRKAARQFVTQRVAEEVQLPFLMKLQRPNKSRVEIQFNGQTAVQVFDGANGWKFRPFLNRQVVEPFTEAELKGSSAQAGLDGFLVDYAAKGTRIELAGMEKVEGRDNYKLKLTLAGGQSLHVWLDAHTFLETKIEGQPRRLDGTDHPVEVYYRDYRAVNGLQIPFLLETRVLPVAQTALGTKDPPVPSERTVLEKVEVNPKLDAALFTKPEVVVASNNK